ncbi:hypothetical protein K0M31_009940, partial [Melipona bicolor]
EISVSLNGELFGLVSWVYERREISSPLVGATLVHWLRGCIGEITCVLVLLVRMARKKSNTRENRVKIGGKREGTSSLLKGSLGKRSGKEGPREAKTECKISHLLARFGTSCKLHDSKRFKKVLIFSEKEKDSKNDQ